MRCGVQTNLATGHCPGPELCTTLHCIVQHSMIFHASMLCFVQGVCRAQEVQPLRLHSLLVIQQLERGTVSCTGSSNFWNEYAERNLLNHIYG